MSEYRVVPMAQLFPWPGVFAKEYDKEYCSRLAEALEKESAEGWELVSTYCYHGYAAPGYAIFRREKMDP